MMPDDTTQPDALPVYRDEEVTNPADVGDHISTRGYLGQRVAEEANARDQHDPTVHGEPFVRDDVTEGYLGNRVAEARAAQAGDGTTEGEIPGAGPTGVDGTPRAADEPVAPVVPRQDYESLTVPDLQAMLGESGQPTSGTKAELIDRLMARDADASKA